MSFRLYVSMKYPRSSLRFAPKRAAHNLIKESRFLSCMFKQLLICTK